jgi:hypothetical protein
MFTAGTVSLSKGHVTVSSCKSTHVPDAMWSSLLTMYTCAHESMSKSQEVSWAHADPGVLTCFWNSKTQGYWDFSSSLLRVLTVSYLLGGNYHCSSEQAWRCSGLFSGISLLHQSQISLLNCTFAEDPP